MEEVSLDKSRLRIIIVALIILAIVFTVTTSKSGHLVSELIAYLLVIAIVTFNLLKKFSGVTYQYSDSGVSIYDGKQKISEYRWEELASEEIYDSRFSISKHIKVYVIKDPKIHFSLDLDWLTERSVFSIYKKYVPTGTDLHNSLELYFKNKNFFNK